MPRRRHWFFPFGTLNYRFEGRTNYQAQLNANLLDETIFTARRSASGPLFERLPGDTGWQISHD